MAWDHLSITKSHLVYIILGGFTSLFMLCSSVIKERMYIGEATVATLCGIIFGPHAANLIDPGSWGNVDEVTLEFSRIVLVVQCFAVGVELPRYYMEKHWKSVIFLLLPVMTFGWLITSLFIWWLIPPLTWLQSLAIAACVTATDPVLASSVVGKGKFAKRVPRHLRDLLSAESGCNDGMAFPFIYLALYLLQEHNEAGPTVYHWILYTCLYECVFGAVYGFIIGYIARRGIRFAEKHDLIDRESFLVFYFTLALFCAGSGSLLGVDDLLVGFAAGVGFSNDGWFSEKTEESHVSNVIDLLINLAYFVFLGTIIPWEQYNNVDLGLSVWRLVVIAILVIFFRRIPIMMALKPLIPDVKTWREALFAGHFGPIGVGAIFVAILCRAELEHEGPIPLAELPPSDVENYEVIAAVWPIVTFMVICSILVHGSSVAVFTLGKRINTLQLTMSYTQAVDDGPSWMNRLPRISSQSKSQARTMSDTDFDDKQPEFPPGTLPPTGFPGSFLRRQREEETGGSRASSLVSRRRRTQGNPGAGGPVSQSAIFPQRRSEQFEEPMSPTDDDVEDNHPEEDASDAKDDKQEKDTEKAAIKKAEAAEDEKAHQGEADETPQVNVYDEGDHIVVEDGEGQVLAVEEGTHEGHLPSPHKVKEAAKHEIQKPHWTYDSLKKSIGRWRDEELSKRRGKDKDQRKHEPARAYQFGNTIIVEDEDGEVLKKYDLPAQEGDKDYVGTSLKYMGLGALANKPARTPQEGEPSGTTNEPRPGKLVSRSTFTQWSGLGRKGTGDPATAAGNTEGDAEDDRKIRFTIGGAGQRMNKDDFLREVQKLDVQTRRQVINQSTAPATVKEQAKAQPAAKSISGPSAPVRLGQAGGSGAAKGGKAPAASSSPDSESSKRSGKAPMRGPATDVEAEMDTRGRKPAAAPEAQSSLSEPPAGPEEETAAERRRRLAAFASVREDDDAQETPAERRRRAAALGLADDGGDSDSDDDNTPRMTASTRRGIRFADE